MFEAGNFKGLTAEVLGEILCSGQIVDKMGIDVSH